MDVARPHASLIPSLEGDVLVVLARTRQPLTGREVSRLVKVGSQAGVQRALNRLLAQGVVTRALAGRAQLFGLNRDHLTAPLIEALASLRSGLIDRLKAEIANWKVRPFHASLFGSAARGDGDTDSDLDLFLVRRRSVNDESPTWRAQLHALAEHAQRWTGNRASLIEVSEADLPRLRRTRPNVVANLERDAIVLAGPTARSLLRRRA